MTPSIYIDLDECLIHSILERGGNSKQRIRMSLGKEHYSVQLRPIAHEMLQNLRATKREVKLLTIATKEYSLTANGLFKLGFAECQIIAREDYLHEVNIGYGKSIETTEVSVSPNSVLIDNAPVDSESARLKCAYLGIPKKNYIQVREYTGGKDPQKFQQEWLAVIKRINNILTS